MIKYDPPVEDMRFLLGEVLDFEGQICSLPGWEDLDTDLAGEILLEAGRFCADIIVPLNQLGDEQGCTLRDGEVTTPAGTPKAYHDYVAAGWASMSGDPAYGGQGLPRTLQIMLDEMVSSGSISFGLFPGLTRGAAEALAHHGSADLKARWMPGLVSGETCGAMALTEGSAGTDLGLLTCRAEPAEGKSYAVTGTKIFISSGDQDFGNNIVHLVLARLPDAAPGTKGISMFLVPKLLDEGEQTRRNAMSVGALEQKMGIHAQPTCVMNYDGATGWLVGEPGRGLNAMFTMMNAERLFVGIEGLGIAEIAQQNAVAYARERLQGRSADGSRSPVPIIEHADVRKMLLQGRAFIDPARALAIWTAMQMDIALRHPDKQARAQADGFVALLTPVIKAAFTDMGFETAVLSQQVFGGHGYIREWGMEQFVRDARITQIYEGTNGVQAMDFVGRKLPMEDGALALRFYAMIDDDLQLAEVAGVSHEVLVPMKDALSALRQTTEHLAGSKSDLGTLGAAATDMLRMFALVALGWMWVRMAMAVQGQDGPLADRKRHVARFFTERMLPQVHALARQIEAGPDPLMQMDPELF